ncbi:MAG: hypothetical protein GVY18_12260 [Bacteroidetes bacterium]|jgi:hypothetical protein|nr:hypothetical protein [Bacteroidota bacterium]
MFRSFLILCLLGFMAACQSTHVPLDDRLVGTWTMDRILEDGRDVTAQHDPADNRWIRFYADRTFESDGDPYGPNDGEWALDDSTLFLDSAAGDGDDSYWIVQIEDDVMRWSGARSDFTERFVIWLSRR